MPSHSVHLSAEVTRILFIRNLPYDVTSSTMYQIFGQYGGIRQIRLCVNIRGYTATQRTPTSMRSILLHRISSPYKFHRSFFFICRGDAENMKTRGTAFVVYDDIFDAHAAQKALTGYSVDGRYLTVLFFRPGKTIAAKSAAESEAAEIEALKAEILASRSRTAAMS